MRKLLRTHGSTILVALVTSAVFAGGPAIAAIVANAHRVDGKHAVGSSASASQRAGKLVATNSAGRLPNNIIAKANDSDKLDGQDSSAFLGAGAKAADSDRLDGRDSSEFLGDTVTVVQNFTNFASNNFGTGSVFCPAGYTATGGGVDPANVLELAVTSSAPLVGGTRPQGLVNGQHGSSNGWFGAVARQTSTGDFSFKVAVICSQS